MIDIGYSDIILLEIESMKDQTVRDHEIEQTMELVISASQSIPLVDDLETIIRDSERASRRSYYFPDEDERLRSVFASYLRSRTILVDAIESLMPTLTNKLNWKNELRSFAVGYTAGCLLVRATKYVIGMARQHPVIWKKLDESEPRYGIERKTISKLYESLSSPKKMHQFYQATRFFESKKNQIFELSDLSSLDHEVVQLLKEELPFIESRKRDFFQRRFRYRIYEIFRRNSSGYKKAMFQLFRLTGKAVAEMKQPSMMTKSPKSKSKRVTQNLLEEISPLLLPGDIIITRHDDALSNLFLPGFWPHAAFYIGSPTQRASLNLAKLPATEHEIIESKKDGVKFRHLSETLSVDNFVIIRSNLSQKNLAKIIESAISHEGKRYDFLFDFTSADRLACTELIYRIYHGVDDLEFILNVRSGRKCISAEDLIDQLIRSGRFSVHSLFTEETGKIIYNSEAQAALKVSYSSNW